MDKIEFTKGFVCNGFKYGWFKSKLFRLPTTKNDREYSLREVPKININENIIGYRIQREKKSIAQVENMSKKVSYKIKASLCPQCK
jgi:hypothetical protein